MADEKQPLKPSDEARVMRLKQDQSFESNVAELLAKKSRLRAQSLQIDIDWNQVIADLKYIGYRFGDAPVEPEKLTEAEWMDRQKASGMTVISKMAHSILIDECNKLKKRVVFLEKKTKKKTGKKK